MRTSSKEEERKSQTSRSQDASRDLRKKRRGGGEGRESSELVSRPQIKQGGLQDRYSLSSSAVSEQATGYSALSALPVDANGRSKIFAEKFLVGERC